MTEKYIDLKPQIASYYALAGATAALGGVEIALKWLDSHPGQAPGRTVTEREVARVQQEVIEPPRPMTFESMVGAVLDALGITVVPDPEPTNAEKLLELYREASNHGRDDSYYDLMAFFDEQGVKAPGGDDD